MAQNATSAFAAINARIRVMYSTLLTAQDFSSMVETTDLDGLLSFLKNTPYGPYLDRSKEKDISARHAAYLLHLRMSDIFHSIVSGSPDGTKDFLLQFYRYYEVNNLKAILRGIITNSPWDKVRYVLFPYNQGTTLPAEQMLESGSVSQAVELLRETPYYSTLSFAVKRFNAEQTLFPIEVALDLDYWRELWKEMKQLPKSDQDYAVKLIGPLVDMNNLMWAIRYKTYHHLSEEEIINYTLSVGYHVCDDDIRGIAAGSDISQTVKKLYPQLPNVDELLQDLHTGLPRLELLLQKQIAQQCRAAFLGNPFQIGIALGYLLLFEYEIQDLVVLLEAKSNQVPNDKIRNSLVIE